FRRQGKRGGGVAAPAAPGRAGRWRCGCGGLPGPEPGHRLLHHRHRRHQSGAEHIAPGGSALPPGRCGFHHGRLAAGRQADRLHVCG
ncbi:hypothetical protein HaLaN_12273, partial [Haematococcus lacustris]